jgi:hypothetical protein
MYEELFYETEKAERSRHEKIFVCSNGIHSKLLSSGPYALTQSVHSLIEAAHTGDMGLLLHTLVEIVPQYRDYEISGGDGKKPETKRGLVLPIEKVTADGPARPASAGFSFKPM